MKLWTIASSMPEMQMQKSDSGWSYSFGVGRETRNFPRQEKLRIMKCQTGRQTGMDSLERISNDSSDLGYRNGTSCFEHGNEPLDPIIYHGFPDLLKRYQQHKKNLRHGVTQQQHIQKILQQGVTVPRAIEEAHSILRGLRIDVEAHRLRNTNMGEHHRIQYRLKGHINIHKSLFLTSTFN